MNNSPTPTSTLTRLLNKFIVIFLAMLMCACTTTPDRIAGVSDPLEPLNRVTFKINSTIDNAILSCASTRSNLYWKYFWQR
jgi:ABC-type transporter lipoprotein component MlaA